MEQNKAERLNENVTEKMCSSDGNVVGEMCSPADADTCGDGSCTTSDRFVKILDLREGNEESSGETTGCKASVYAKFDDCLRVGKFVKLFDFRHFEGFSGLTRVIEKHTKRQFQTV